MSNYDEIKNAIQDVTTSPSWAIQGFYNGETTKREFLAYVLGKSHAHPGTRDSVLGYQYDGPHTSTDDSLKWRCFKVDSFTSLSKTPFAPPPTLLIPAPLTADQLNRQNCVDIPGGRIVRSAAYHP